MAFTAIFFTATRAFGQIDLNPSEFLGYPGEADGFNRHLVENIRYPTTLAENCIQGLVIVRFTVKSDGTVGDFNTVHSPHPKLTEEVVRVVQLSGGKWRVAPTRGKMQVTRLTLPFSFALDDGGYCPTVASYYSKGKKLFDKGKYKDALPYFQSAFTIDASNVKNNFILAECFKRLERTADLCELMEKTDQIYRSHPDFQGSLATLKEYYGAYCGQ